MLKIKQPNLGQKMYEYFADIQNFFFGPFGLVGLKKKTEDRTEPQKTERTQTGPDQSTALIYIYIYLIKICILVHLNILKT